MPYYNAGDYYRGDYYRGDFFKSLGKIFKGVVHGVESVGKFIPGIGTAINVAEGAIGAVSGLVGGGHHPNLPAPALNASLVGGGGGAPGMRIGAVNIGGNAANEVGLINVGGGPSGFGALPTTKGYHPNRSTYESRGGGTSRWPQQLMLHPKGSALVRNRRMNVGNARALKRALRRAYGFEKLARRVLHLTSPKKHFSGFKKHKKRR